MKNIEEKSSLTPPLRAIVLNGKKKAAVNGVVEIDTKQADFQQNDPTAPDYIKHKPDMQIEFKKTIAETYMSKPNTICNGAILAPFSVSETKKVFFSKGNLQYRRIGSHLTAEGTTIKGTWRFAERQFDCVGGKSSGLPDVDPSSSDYNPAGASGNVYYDNGGVSIKCDNNNSINPEYNGWFDNFAWGTSGYNSGVAVHNPGDFSTDLNDYIHKSAYTRYCDWGIYNAISNGGNTPNCWRLLSHEELNYLFTSRENASGLFDFGSITLSTPTPDGVTKIGGIIVLPDTWTTVPEGCEFNLTDKTYTATSGNSFEYNYSPNGFDTNSYTETQWSLMESQGAIFIPAAGLLTQKDKYLAEGYKAQVYKNQYTDIKSAIYCMYDGYYTEQTHYSYLENQNNRIKQTARNLNTWYLPVRLVTDIPTEFQADWNQEDSTKSDYIKNKPILGGVQFKIEDDSLKTSIDGGSTWKTVQLTE